jgi:hypothetical protein
VANTPEGDHIALALPDETATIRLAEDIAAVLRPGDLVALSGGLGAGKTSFARAAIRAVAGDLTRDVPSPTFPIRIDHDLARMTISHATSTGLAGPEISTKSGWRTRWPRGPCWSSGRSCCRRALLKTASTSLS